MTTDPNALGILTLRSPDGATAELDARAIPPGTVVILQSLDAVGPDVLTLARQQLVDILGDEVAARFLIADNGWRIWPVPITEPRLEDRATFTFRPAGEPEDVTVALRGLGDCAVCGHGVPAGALAARIDDPEVHGWAHESCAHPQRPARAALDADQTRNRS